MNQEQITKLLISYIMNERASSYIFIDNYNIDGSICYVEFYLDEAKYYKENILINIWEMLVFLYEYNTKYTLL